MSDPTVANCSTSACLPDSLFQLLTRGTVAQIEFDSAFLVKWLPAASREPACYFKQRKSTATVWGQWKTQQWPNGAEKCPAAVAHLRIKQSYCLFLSCQFQTYGLFLETYCREFSICLCNAASHNAGAVKLSEWADSREDERLNCIGDPSLEHQTEAFFPQQSVGLRGDRVVISWQWGAGHVGTPQLTSKTDWLYADCTLSVFVSLSLSLMSHWRI